MCQVRILQKEGYWRVIFFSNLKLLKLTIIYNIIGRLRNIYIKDSFFKKVPNQETINTYFTFDVYTKLLIYYKLIFQQILKSFQSIFSYNLVEYYSSSTSISSLVILSASLFLGVIMSNNDMWVVSGAIVVVVVVTSVSALFSAHLYSC